MPRGSESEKQIPRRPLRRTPPNYTRTVSLAWLVLAFPLLLSRWIPRVNAQAARPGATVFEGARLIIGDGSAPIENSAFVIAGNTFTEVGRRGEVRVPAGAAHVDLTGKTVMPALVDMHGHIGYQDIIKGTMSKAFYTRENLIDHLQRLAYNGVSAIVSIADLEDRSDLHGGRTNWGDVPLRVRMEVIPNAALFKTAGVGIAWPGSGPQGDPSRVDVPYLFPRWKRRAKRSTTMCA
jgi:hypothetical protein